MASILLSPMWIVVSPHQHIFNYEKLPPISPSLEHMLLEYLWMRRLWCTDYEWVFLFVLLMMNPRWECDICHLATHCTHRLNDDSLGHSESYSMRNRRTFNILLSSQFHSSTNCPAINNNSLPDKCCARTRLLIEQSL